jgi:outer membrane protein assembly factor BamB/tetratricopeptide (TPR) repeat protein
MALRGDLASVDLAQVFQMLALNKKVGLLSIQSPRLWKVLYFDARGVSLYYNQHSLLDRAIATFVRVGRVQAAAVEEIRDHAGRNQLDLLDSILAGGYLTDEELAAQMRYEVEEEIYELFFCKDARFEFLEGQDSMPEREGTIDSRFFFNTESVIMEAARRIDEWSYIAERIVNGLEVFCRAGKAPDPEDVGEECAIVYDCVDGRRTVARIVEVSGLSSFVVFKNLSQLLDAGAIQTLASDQLVKVGETCMREGRPHDAINLFEKAIELSVGVPEVHSLAAAAYESTAEYENSIYHLKCDAEYRIAAGDIRGAAQRLRAAGLLVPTDLSARERLVELALSHHEVRLPDFDPVEEGKVLVDLLMAAGDLRRVRSLLERLVTVGPDDIELKKLLVNVHSKAGDQPRVIELYESIAKTLVRQHRPLEAVAFLQKILMLDRTRSDISEQVRSLYALDERARSRRRAMATLGVICLLLVALAVAYSFYDQAATTAFEEINVEELVQADEYDQAVATFDEFLIKYPLTTAAARAREELARIDGLRLKYEAALLNRGAARERELQRQRTEYKAEWRRHRELFLDGKPEAALAAIERVRQLLAATAGQEDMEWALEEQVEKTWAKMREFLDQATDLERKRAVELEAGRFTNAWALSVELADNYDITAVARRTRIPIQLTSRPLGARVLRDGAPLTETVNGKERPVTTPALLMCGRDPAAYALELDGFETVSFTVEPRRAAAVEVPMKVIPARRVRLVSEAQTEVSGSGDWIVVGMRNGKVGIISARSGEVRRVVDLGGLRAVEGVPVVAGDRVWFFTNEGALECLLLETGRGAPGWPVRPASPAIMPMTVRDGRLLFVDRDNVLHCLDQGDGHEFWAQPLNGAAVGPAMLDHRIVRIGVADGRVLKIDAIDGTAGNIMRCPAGLSTRVFADAGKMWLGCNDGRVRAVDERSGRVLWSVDIGRNPVDGEMELGRSGVLVFGTDNRLLRLDRDTGEQLGVQTLPAPLESMRLRRDTVLTVVRFPRDGQTPTHDLLQARTADTLALLWEYQDVGTFTGAPGADGVFVAVAGADGDVVLFR